MQRELPGRARAHVSPAEVLVSEEQRRRYSVRSPAALAYDGYAFLPEQAWFTLLRAFQSTKSLDGFGC